MLAAVLYLSCAMTVGKPDPIHSLSYAYGVTVDEDAGRASDDFGAYLITPYLDGRGYAWLTQWPANGGPAWTTRYDLDTTTLRLSAQDWSSDSAQIGSSSGSCTAG